MDQGLEFLRFGLFLECLYRDFRRLLISGVLTEEARVGVILHQEMVLLLGPLLLGLFVSWVNWWLGEGLVND